MNICEICNCRFSKPFYLEKHYQSKKHTDRIHQDAVIHKCKCGKTYLHKQSLNTHKKKCKYVKQREDLVDYYEQTIENHEKEKAELKEQIGNLLDRLATSSKIENKIIENNIENVENQTNITINYFGNENLDYITNKVLISCIGKVYGSIQALVETIHFHPDHPENHNIKITNKKLQHAQVMNRDKKWKLVHRNQVIEQLMDKSYQLLEDSFEENKDVIPEKKKTNFEHFKQKYDDDKEVKRQIKNDVDLLVLNGFTGS